MRSGRALKRGANECLSLGLVGIHDAGVSTETLRTYEKLYTNDELPFRVYAMLRPKAARSLRAPMIDRFDGQFSARAVKRFMDGALGSRGAFLLDPYSDQPHTTGLPQLDLDTLASETREFTSLGFQTCTHANRRRRRAARARRLRASPGGRPLEAACGSSTPR